MKNEKSKVENDRNYRADPGNCSCILYHTSGNKYSLREYVDTVDDIACDFDCAVFDKKEAG